MGVVYLAEDPALERLIALKTIDLALAVPEPEREAFERRFLVEARVAARLSHPGIVVVHDVGRDADSAVLFIALEYLPGQTLEDLMAGGNPVDWREALRLTAQVARALHHAHLHGIVHRDVKPANIMLLPAGETKIMDFGIAKVPEVQLTAAGQFFGTPLYMSPEQALGRPLDARSDLFSLGAIAYLLLTGRPAFKAENMMEVLARVVHDLPTRPSRLAPDLAEDVDELIARAMAKDPADRYPDGEAFARDAEELLAGRPLAEAAWLEELGLLDGTDAGLASSTFKTGPSLPVPALVRPPSTSPNAPTVLPETASLMRTAPPASPRGRLVPLLIAAAGVLVGILLVVALLKARSPEARVAVREPALREATPRVALATPLPRAPTQRDDDAPEDRESIPRGESRLVVDFEHHLKSGTLRVFIDDEKVVEEALDSRVTKKILTLRLRKGSVDEVIAVEPGKHEIRVQLQWDGRTKSRWLRATFEGGTSRTLRIRVSRLFNDLSLELR
jgi:serine/threonine protein kinase